MTDHTEQASGAAFWLDEMLRTAYPQSAGVTLAAVEALVGQETFTGPQVAYLMSVMFDVGACTRTAADRAELAASRAANFSPAHTREARIVLRVAAMAEQAELHFMRRPAGTPEPWPGGSPDEALNRYGWDSDRDDLPDLGPSAAHWHPGAGVPTRRAGRSIAWRDDT